MSDTDHSVSDDHEKQFDYIVVGSGAGGAPLASRLAREGKKVLVIEAGANHTQRGAHDPANEVSRVPLLHAVSTEHPDLSWRFFVDHYERDGGRLPDGVQEDPKWHEPNPDEGEDESHEGIFYPRAAALGGCTVHNAMITIVGPDSDWDELAEFLGDASWNGRQMRGYFKRLENNGYLPIPSRSRRHPMVETWRYLKNSFRFLLGRIPDGESGHHGFHGWLHTNFADLSIGLKDRQLVKMIKAALWQSKWEGLDNAWTLVRTLLRSRVWESLDPNHSETQANSPEGVVLIPLAVHGRNTTIHQNRETPFAMLGRRSSPREFLLETAALYPDSLTIWTNCLVTKVILDDSKTPRAGGVEYQRGERLYRAHVHPSRDDVPRKEVRVRPGGEVILCGGAFNTPQLLMLSGIGDPSELSHIHDPRSSDRKPEKIECRVRLPGVGKNLQDRYEVSIVSEMKRDFSTLDRATFRLPDVPDEPDPHLQRWREEGAGLYATNGAVLGIFKRSRPELAKPDLFIFGIPSEFRGYRVGYSKVTPRNQFTWVILKSHTQNRSGFVKLRSTDPHATPRINFNYFGTAAGDRFDSSKDQDVAAILQGVKFVRKILKSAKSVVKTEVHPGDRISSDSTTNEWIRRDAWGHHACGTCRMGPSGDPNAVLDSQFRVRGVNGLRVVDASIFPKIPGYFIVSNIYMASEKAADVILNDPGHGSFEMARYPRELRDLESKAINVRRGELIRGRPADAKATEKASLSKSSRQSKRNESRVNDDHNCLHANGKWQDNVTGIALSGGGIRSATFSLGILQSLARRDLLRRVDILSTVSGGGYIGSFLGRCYDRLRTDPLKEEASRSGVSPADHVRDQVASSDSPAIRWLRNHGNYIAPRGRGDGRLNVAVFVRNLLSAHLVIGLSVFTLFGIVNAIRYSAFDWLFTSFGLFAGRLQLPIQSLIESWVGPWFSPWFVLAEVLILFLVLPRIVGYWIVSPDRHESFKHVPLGILFFASVLVLWLGVRDALQFPLIVLGVALLSSLIQVELAWWRGYTREAAAGSGGTATQRGRTRNYLTYDLGLGLSLAGGALGFALIDSIAHGLHEWKLESNVTYARAFAAIGAALVAGLPLARWLFDFVRERLENRSAGLNVLRNVFASFATMTLAGLVLVTYSFASHAAFRGGNAWAFGVGATLIAFIVTVCLAFPSAIGFVNRSSLAQTYAARLARAYLGASNPARHRPEGQNVTEVIPGDDVAIRQYRPHEASGPLHLINVIINQTIDDGSRLRKRDRRGTGMAVSCLGVSVGEGWHSRWTDASDVVQRGNPDAWVGLKPIGRSVGAEHPLVDQLDRPADRVEALTLRQWMAISGAAVDPGRGETTSLGTALLMGLVNARTGHWWDTGISEAARRGFPNTSPLRRLLYLVPRFFATQSLLAYEWIARYAGPWQRFWHLGDGGYFENLGCYELIRRRIPRMIVCDGTADPDYEFAGFAELVRKARIDFGARIESFSAEEIQKIPKPATALVGTLDELRPRKCPRSQRYKADKHAALCWVHYGECRRPSVMLYFKALVADDVPEDIKSYHTLHTEFPHEPTSDQFFDEAQWESYRKLGEHLGDRVFPGDNADWFWAIPLGESDEDKK